MQPLEVTDAVRITRRPERQLTDRQVLYDVLDAGLVAHVALVRDDLPVVLPLGYARSGDALLLHGSAGGGLLRDAAQGAPLAVTVTLLDGLVFARSLFDSSMNYRSVMVRGTATVLHGQDELDALTALSEHLMPGRWDEVRPPTRRELAATMVLRLPLDQASVKVRASGATTDPDDGEPRQVWAGVIPLTVQAGTPQPSPDTPGHVADTTQRPEHHPAPPGRPNPGLTVAGSARHDPEEPPCSPPFARSTAATCCSASAASASSPTSTPAFSPSNSSATTVNDSSS